MADSQITYHPVEHDEFTCGGMVVECEHKTKFSIEIIDESIIEELDLILKSIIDGSITDGEYLVLAGIVIRLKNGVASFEVNNYGRGENDEFTMIFSVKFDTNDPKQKQDFIDMLKMLSKTQPSDK